MTPAPPGAVLSHQLVNHLGAAACSRRLLVATDFDGTLVDLRDDPDDVWLSDRAAALLADLAAQPGVTVAVLSGRSLSDLRRRLGGVDGVQLIGSHGAEWEDDARGALLHPSQDGLLASLSDRLEEITADCVGTWVERKPIASVFHYRAASPECAAESVRRVLDGPARSSGIHVRHGKDCVEIAVVEVTKGLAIDRLRADLRADRVVFFGDDVTDEDGFRVLRREDVGVKVGAGESGAEYRASSIHDVVDVLTEILRVRRGFVADFPAYVT